MKWPRNNNQEDNTIIDRFFDSMSEDVVLSFTCEQKKEIEASIVKNTSRGDHYLDLRPVLGFGNWRYYVIFLIGKDRRGAIRKKDSLTIYGKSLFILIGSIGIFMASVLIMYLIKSALGIDIFKHFSFGVWDAFQRTFLS